RVHGRRDEQRRPCQPGRRESLQLHSGAARDRRSGDANRRGLRTPRRPAPCGGRPVRDGPPRDDGTRHRRPDARPPRGVPGACRPGDPGRPVGRAPRGGPRPARRPDAGLRTPAVIVDAHHRFWDPATADYPWLTDDLAPIRRAFGPADLEPDLLAAGVDATVLVQTRSSREETVDFLAVAAETPFVHGVVGWVDLTQPD